MSSGLTHPLVLWAQRNDTVLVTVSVNDIANEKFSMEENKLIFYGESGDGGDAKFACDLQFYKDIIPHESKHSKTARGIFFVIKKKESGPYWPRLTADKKVHYVKTDFNRWKDESDTESDTEFDQDSNLQAMMQQMGGLGGGSSGGDLPGMDQDLSSDDSDDEPVPVETETTPT